MTAVVNDNIRYAELINNLLQEDRVTLIADANMDSVFFVCFTFRVDINSDDRCKWAEVSSPHLQGSAVKYTNLQKSSWLVDP